MQPETKFKNKVLPLLKALPRSYVLKTQEVAKRGIPDIIMCLNDKFVALELKKDSKSKITDLQKWNLDSIQSANGIAFTVHPDNWDRVYAFLKTLAKED